VRTKTVYPASGDMPIASSPGANWLISNATHVDSTERPATGAAVESTIHASFSRETRMRSVSGRMEPPTISVFA
jgi:hypothetical protein